METDDRAVKVYLDLPRGCLEFTATEVFAVARRAAVHSAIWAYYDPDLRADTLTDLWEEAVATTEQWSGAQSCSFYRRSGVG